MKIFYKKDFYGVLEEKNKLKEEFENYKEEHKQAMSSLNSKYIEQLEDNWNKLKEYMIKEQTRIVIENTDEDEFVYTDLLIKMQGLEQGSDSKDDK